MFDVIFTPIKAIERQKKSKSTGMAWGAAVVASLIAGLVVILAMIPAGINETTWMLAIGTIIAVFVAIVFGSLLYCTGIHVLTKKGKYQNAITALANCSLIGTIGMLIATLVGMIPVIGIYLILLVLLMVIVLSHTVLVKTLMELDGVDLLPVLAVHILIVVMVFLLFSVGAQLAMMSTLGGLGTMPIA